jgi:hypothetical protein
VSGDGWADLSWQGAGSSAPLRPARPRNRRTVDVVTCPTCHSERVRRKSIAGACSYWICLARSDCPGWKETAATGDGGSAIIA